MDKGAGCARLACVQARGTRIRTIFPPTRDGSNTPPRARARLELGDGADEGLLGALELVREPVLQAVESLPEEGGETEREAREE